jgi:hypothetical protein
MKEERAKRKEEPAKSATTDFTDGTDLRLSRRRSDPPTPWNPAFPAASIDADDANQFKATIP